MVDQPRASRSVRLLCGMESCAEMTTNTSQPVSPDPPYRLPPQCPICRLDVMEGQRRIRVFTKVGTYDVHTPCAGDGTREEIFARVIEAVDG